MYVDRVGSDYIWFTIRGGANFCFLC